MSDTLSCLSAERLQTNKQTLGCAPVKELTLTETRSLVEDWFERIDARAKPSDFGQRLRELKEQLQHDTG